MVMVYDKRFYNDKSPWLMFSKGALASKEDLAFRPEWLGLTDRGFVLSFPMMRGTKYFDDDWFYSGVG
jgi:protease II